MAPTRLRRLNRWLVERLREDLVDLYGESHAMAPGDPYRCPSRQNFSNRLTTDMRRPGFAMVVAETDGLTGCAFGSWGWLDIGELRRPLGATTFRALVYPFGERATARLEGLVTMPGGGEPGGA